MSRSIWKGPFSLLKKKLLLVSKSQKLKQEKIIEVWSRNSMVLPQYIGKDIKIYNGKNWVFRKIIDEMVGHKFGEFCSTKKRTVHKINKIKQASRKK